MAVRISGDGVSKQSLAFGVVFVFGGAGSLLWHGGLSLVASCGLPRWLSGEEIGRASCRERV